MSSILEFIKQFRGRKGTHILWATVVSKIASFVLSVLVIRMLTKEDYGNISYAFTIVSFLMPFMGMGIYQSFVKYAPIQEYLWERKSWFGFTFRKGMFASIVLALLLIVFSPIVSSNQPDSLCYLMAFSGMIISLFMFESVKNYLRIFYLNKAYARIEIIHAVLLLIVGSLLTYVLGAYGYIMALVLVPLCLSSYLLYRKKLLQYSKSTLNITSRKIWVYGIYTSLGGLVSQLIFSIDIMSIGYILVNPNHIAQYKALSIIPFSLLFLPQVVLRTDFVKLVQKANDRKYLRTYISNFMLIFSIISVLMIAFFYFASDWVMLMFGKEYTIDSNLLLVFSFGVAGAYIFRVPFGNILVAIGWSRVNTSISILTLVLDIVLNYYWVHQYGIIGAAYATSFLLWFSGVCTFLAFWVYLRRLKQ